LNPEATLVDILVQKSSNLAKHCWVERWLAEKDSLATERFIEVVDTYREKAIPK
jgi:hypothetical protein